MITTYQIRNVLRVYGDQLKRRNSMIQDSLRPSHQPSDLVTISMDARRKQMVNNMSNHLISQITPDSHMDESDEGTPIQDLLPTE